MKPGTLQTAALPALLAVAGPIALTHALNIADETDLVNLLVFFGSAGTIGGLSSRRRSAQLDAEAPTSLSTPGADDPHPWRAAHPSTRRP